jgi:hypothetical protein
MNESAVDFVKELAVDPSRSSSDPERRQVVLEMRQQLRSKAVRSSKRKQEATKKKAAQRKEVVRFSSPCHFLVDPAQENNYGAEHELDLPDRDRVDTLLRGVALTFYSRRAVNTQSGTVTVDQEYDVHQYITLDRLRSALRRPRPGEDWTPREVALFEAGICQHGKNFPAIRQVVSSRQLSEVVAFYYRVFKKSSHYRIWKANASLANSNTSALPSFSAPAPSSVSAAPAPSSSSLFSSSTRPASSSSSLPAALPGLDMARRASPRLRGLPPQP